MRQRNHSNRPIRLTRAATVSALLCLGLNPLLYGQYVPPPQLVAGVDYSKPNYANTPTLRKFVDRLPGLGAAAANNLGQYIPVAVADTTTFPGSAYYEIALVEYTEQMHSDLGPTRLRGYVQVETPAVLAALQAAGRASAHYALPGGKFAIDKPSYLGPTIVATKGVATRVLFDNLLPAGATGNLFIPTDVTVMGAGMGPDGSSYPQNRATLHLHGGDNPWISDGTAHQWITPAAEPATLKKGVSQRNVPDMPVPANGSATFYWPNNQSGRLMFYHDHAMGLTRLNVYGGAAAGYLLTDPTERALNAFAPGGELPLVIQDKTFVGTGAVPANFPAGAAGTPATTAVDPLWGANAAWGQTAGSLWFPHVYMPNQNPNDLSGANPMGRWDYGAWFWPVFPSLAPPQTSIVPEAFMDTPVINGTAYPYLEVQPAAYRFRLLNACNDRYMNLQMYVADPGFSIAPAGNTEVRMVAAAKNGGVAPGALDGAAVAWPATWTANDSAGMTPDVLDGREGGVPDPSPSLQGPSFVHIGSEGGIAPAPVVMPNTPIGYEQNKRSVTVLNTLEHTLFLGPAERADVIVDFSQYAGKTLIVYNDAPAPLPAGDPRYDYYTGNPDFTAFGGAPSTQPGFGPNTRTIMQIRVGGSGNGTALDPATLAAPMAAAHATQDAPIVPAGTYARISDTSMTINGAVVPLQSKAIQELFDPFGRMNATLGVEVPFTTSVIQTTIPYGFADPVTEVLNDNSTQLWKITHNGVDTHAIHFHLFNVQLVNRVGWDGAIKPPFPEEMGWKETVKMNPLEDIVVALHAKTPQVPFKLGNNVRPLDPTMPLGSTTSFLGVDPGNNPVTVTNQNANYGAEYTWHCHLLGHEENDMMRPMAVAVAPEAPTLLTASVSGSGKSKSAKLAWTNNAQNATGYTVQRATDPAFGNGLTATNLGVVSAYTDPIGNTTQAYYYRVFASNLVGSGVTGFPSATAASGFSNSAGVNIPTAPAAPSNLAATIASSTSIRLTWRDNSNNENGFRIERAVNGGAYALLVVTAANVTTYTDTTAVAGNTYAYRVAAVNGGGTSAFTTPVTVAFTVPAAPSGFNVTAARANSRTDTVTLRWTDNASNETGFTLQSATNAAFTAGLTTTNLPANLTTAQDVGLPRATSYYYRIRATNTVGVSAWVTATPLPVVTP
jgi:FtsP/CotA-like multicopper oxidase with cupredoxin domain/fibronectin type 3 domain-containing protein